VCRAVGTRSGALAEACASPPAGSPSAAHTFTPAAAEPQLRRAFSADLVAETIALACDDADADAALCCRLSRARQTVDFVSRKRMSYGLLDKAVMTLPQALLHLRSCPSVSVRLVLGEAGPPTRHLGPGLLLAGRLLADYPEQPWFAVVGLLHVLGRLLLHPGFGAAPVWEVVGESALPPHLAAKRECRAPVEAYTPSPPPGAAFPVGCRFDPRISYANWFGANPDRRKRLYGTPYGMYHPGCGLADVDMCWSGDEYATEVVLRNHSKLPPHALFCLRYGSFATLGVGSAYEQLMNEQDREAMPWLLSMRAAKRLAYADVRSAADAENNAEAWLAQLQPLMDAYIPGVLCF